MIPPPPPLPPFFAVKSNAALKCSNVDKRVRPRLDTKGGGISSANCCARTRKRTIPICKKPIYEGLPPNGGIIVPVLCARIMQPRRVIFFAHRTNRSNGGHNAIHPATRTSKEAGDSRIANASHVFRACARAWKIYTLKWTLIDLIARAWNWQNLKLRIRRRATRDASCTCNFYFGARRTGRPTIICRLRDKAVIFTSDI